VASSSRAGQKRNPAFAFIASEFTLERTALSVSFQFSNLRRNVFQTFSLVNEGIKTIAYGYSVSRRTESSGRERRIEMRKALPCFLLLIVSLSAYGQDCCPKYEISLRYSYFNTDGKGDGIISNQFSSRSGQNGGGGGFAVNRIRIGHSLNIDVIGDLSYQRKELTIGALTVGGLTLADARTKQSSFLFLFGPRFSSGSDEVNFFVQALAGGIHRTVESTGSVNLLGQTSSQSINSSSTNFALAFGAGTDIKAAKHLKVRLFQFDYIPSRSRNDSLTGEHEWSHNYRLQAGLVINWGLSK